MQSLRQWAALHTQTLIRPHTPTRTVARLARRAPLARLYSAPSSESSNSSSSSPPSISRPSDPTLSATKLEGTPPPPPPPKSDPPTPPPPLWRTGARIVLRTVLGTVLRAVEIAIVAKALIILYEDHERRQRSESGPPATGGFESLDELEMVQGHKEI